MSSNPLQAVFGVRRPLIGMLHLPALPGSPGHDGSLRTLRDRVLEDASHLVEGGFHGLLLENYGDTPFHPGRVPHHVVAYMTALAVAVREEFDLPLGINVLRNDGQSALAVAHAAGARFIRVNVLAGARLTDQGIIQGIAHDLLRDRAFLDAKSVLIFADFNVKHSAALAARSVEEELSDLVHRAGADAVVVSGRGTGTPTDPKDLDQVRMAAGGRPVLVGSGLTPATMKDLIERADGFIVGTSVEEGGVSGSAVDPERVESLVTAWRDCGGSLREP